ncbi:MULTISPECIES: hypothetical protein [unclassified Pseudofrankia]|uniref:hypothetical protein n=1 Tax=unclassified Pseudofrankia TaxID=2994372 RepID=UPI0012FF5F99|nr:MULTISPECIES: hypothetical protein [unclassified Pseudofrankia]MDT3442352.1 hypothetical protein [Pseudofrankia sp. BMG5.37]
MIYEIEWTMGEEVVPGFLALFTAEIEAGSLEEAHGILDDIVMESDRLWREFC